MMLVSFGLGVLQRCVLVHGVIGQASSCWRSQNGMIRLPMQRRVIFSGFEFLGYEASYEIVESLTDSNATRSLRNRPVRCALVSPKVQAPPTRAVIH
ncbi:hypothetical protein BKA60DRAFT_584327 [Fusarium oxysporum]|nr:hypothetical protein BKA60DRAFT_584327 [Fusarium oxysporum]